MKCSSVSLSSLHPTHTSLFLCQEFSPRFRLFVLAPLAILSPSSLLFLVLLFVPSSCIFWWFPTIFFSCFSYYLPVFFLAPHYFLLLAILAFMLLIPISPVIAAISYLILIYYIPLIHSSYCCMCSPLWCFQDSKAGGTSTLDILFVISYVIFLKI